MIGIDRISVQALRAAGGGGADPAAVAREFEALLLGAAMKLASRPLLKTGLLDGGSAGRMFRDYFYEEIVRQASRVSDLGIAGPLQAEIERMEATPGSRRGGGG